MIPSAEFVKGILRHTRLRGSKGQYRIIQQLGQGGNGTVFLACGNTGPLTGNLCAIKVFHGKSEKRKTRFLLERELGQKLDHRSLVKVLDVGQHLEYPFAVLEYWPDTLSSAIRTGTLSAVAKIAYTLQMLSALSYLAEQGFVHRDIKPDNILVRGPNCALADFGLLLRAEGGQIQTSSEQGLGNEPVDLEHTIVASEAGEARMPRCYRTPELIRSVKDPDYKVPPSSDVYQMGLTLSEMFFGENPQGLPPKGEDGKFDLSSALVMNDLPAISQGTHARIRESIITMFDKEPTARPTSADLLDEWLGIFDEACDRSIELDRRLIVHW